ncbi:hypothetical protein JCM19240_5617 [Vibrio maritimus]|uniref:Uncharacterized protein n=1 Tax=Vibrio maritimus TaxID=990268 RepID=A0A090SWW6_9VIBR|nr:hypothetical protein JCM19240_5617 [Vibrio maritimus]
MSPTTTSYQISREAIMAQAVNIETIAIAPSMDKKPTRLTSKD